MDERDVARSPATLARGLTLVPAAALIVTNVIGTGVFLKTRVMTCNVGTPGMVLLAWLMAGLLTLAGALTFAELSTMMPRSGGQYNYIDAAFGRLWAFLYGWMETLLDGAASIAAIAMVVVIFTNDLLAGAMGPFELRLAASAVILVVTLLNLLSVHANGRLASIITALKVLLVAGIGVTAFIFGGGSIAGFAVSAGHGVCAGVPEASRLGTAGFGAAMIGALWAYNGWADLSMVAEEVDDPGRTLPRAIIGASLLIILLYLLVNAGYFAVLDAQHIAGLPEGTSVAAAVMVRLFGAGVASLVTAGMILTNFGALHSTFLSVSRIPFAMARDGLLPESLAVISPQTRVPGRAIVALGIIAIAFVFSGSFDMLTDIIVFMLLIFNGMAVAAVYVLRYRFPAMPRPYRVPGYPLVPGLFMITTVFLVVNTFIATPGRAIVSIAIVATGLPAYAWYAARRPANRPGEAFGRPFRAWRRS